MGVLRRMWDLPTVKKMIVNGANAQKVEDHSNFNRQDRRKLAAAAKTKKDALPTEAELAVELMTVLPHAVQAAISTDEQSVWSSLREDSLTIAPSDLIMKHGLTIDGTWSIVGVLDAFPDADDYIPSEGTPTLSTLKQMVARSKLGFLAFSFAPHFVPIIRQLLGRPNSSYGFTPLLLFREISNQGHTSIQAPIFSFQDSDNDA
jgi:hypothetical protein